MRMRTLKTTMPRKILEIPERGFFYHNPTHKYYLNGEKMTGITTILKVAGDANNLIQWAANQAAVKAVMEAASMDIVKFAKAVAAYPKVDTPAAKELDKLFPGFKTARTAHLMIRDTAADVGKEGHAVAEAFEKNEPITVFSEAAQKRARIYIDWYRENVDETYFVERPLFSKSMFVAGTPDGGFRLKDGRNLINDKKFKEYLFDPSPFWQMAAYRSMLEEMAADNDTETPVVIDWGEGRVEEYASPNEYLASFGKVKWDGAVVIRVGTKDFETMFCDTYKEDLEGFMAALTIYRQVGDFKRNKLEIVE